VLWVVASEALLALAALLVVAVNPAVNPAVIPIVNRNHESLVAKRSITYERQLLVARLFHVAMARR
jgi:hypothetical protein